MEWWKEVGLTRAEYDFMCSVEASYSSASDADIRAYGLIAVRCGHYADLYHAVYSLLMNEFMDGKSFTKLDLKPLKARAKKICK